MSNITTFHEALIKLGIEEYEERIFNSNSHGELFHLMDYIIVANAIKDEDISQFQKVFRANVKHAEDTWERPESIFQHLNKM